MAYNLSNTKKTDPIEPPCKKTIYHTFEEAQDIIKYIREKRGGKVIHPYKCLVCGFWHLTSKSEQ